MASRDLLTSLLRDVSRSFYLTMRVLPGGVRRQIGLAYLMARTADTIADTDLLPVEDRLSALDAYALAVESGDASALDFDVFASEQASSAEATLLRRVREPFEVLGGFSDSDQEHIRRVLGVIIGGQRLDLERFGAGESGQLRALETMEELDDYTWRVAGCVGEFWTRICCDHLFEIADDARPRLEENGVRFGKGLQLVNILRDVPKDLENGRCYVPDEVLGEAGLSPDDLRSPENHEQFRETFLKLVAIGEAHLDAGWHYVTRLPFSQFRLRLACAWPVLIGMRTFSLLRAGNPLDPTDRIKVPRAEIYRMMLSTILRVPTSGAWNRLPDIWRS